MSDVQTTELGVGGRADAGAKERAYAVYVLVVLTVVYTVNFMDRYAVVGMAEHIKADLLLTDTQLGLLTGFAFSLLYAVVGFPMAILADRLGHVRVIAGSVALWSVMTFLGGRATGFLSLAATRIGVGIGEAGGTPPAHAILSQTFSRERLPLAMGVYSCGAGLGLTLGLVLGAAAANAFGWRNGFALMALPGLILVPLLLFTIRVAGPGTRPEPVTRAMAVGAMRSVLCDRRLTLLALSIGVAGFSGFANLAWLPSLFARRFGADVAGGLDLGVALGLGNLAGIVLGGPLCALAEQRFRVSLYRVCSVSAALAVIPYAIAYASNSSKWFAATACAALFLHSLIIAPVMTSMQRLARPSEKALASAMVVFSIAVFGSGAGPFFVGLASDFLMTSTGEASLTLGLQLSLVAYFAAVVLFELAQRAVQRHRLHSVTGMRESPRP